MISIIVAVAQNGVIGCDNRLIWHISQDLKRFKAITMGHPIVMGRKTYESIGKPLPGRENIVISRNANLKIEGVKVVSSIEQAVENRPKEEEIFVIGGGEIYNLAMPLATQLYLTKVDQTPDGDTFFPLIDDKEWIEVKRENGDGFCFIDYARKNS